MILDLYIPLYFKFKIYGIFYCGVHQVWNWPSHLYRGWLRQPLNEFLKPIANYCRFILVSKEDRQRIYKSKIRSIRLPKSLEKDTKKYVFCTVIIFQALNRKYDMLLKSSHPCHLPLIAYLVAWCLGTIATPPNTT